MDNLSKYTIADNEVAKYPFDYYAAMRKQDPVHLDPGTGWFYVTHFDNAVAAAQDFETFSSSTDVIFRKTFRPAAQRALDEAGIKVLDTFTTNDPPVALDFHSVGMNLFPPKKMLAISPRIQQICEGLVDKFVDRGSADLNHEFSRLLVGNLLVEELGLSPEDLEQFKTWSECTAELMRIGITEEQEVRSIQKMIKLVRYLAPRIEYAAKHGTPGTAIHTLATMNHRDGRPFTENQRCWMAFITFTGGHNTTINMLNIDVWRLATNPPLQDELRSQPEKIAAYVEEMLRLDGTAQSIVRRVTRDTSIHGTPIPKGSYVMLSLGSANRDEAVWGHDSAAMKLDRPNIRQHVAFGAGVHVCIGKHLARTELRIALEVLLRRIKEIRIKDPAHPPECFPSPFQRGIGPLHVTFEKTS
jgi:cytochrome P450